MPKDRVLEILSVSKSNGDGEIIIELEADYCGFRYNRKIRLEKALEEYDPQELREKISEYFRKRKTELAEEIRRELIE